MPGNTFKSSGAGRFHKEETFARFRKEAEQGDAGQFNLGVCLAEGTGTAKDEKQAVVWYRKAAEQGDAEAQFNLAVCFDTGAGTVKDEKEAVEWFHQAESNGHQLARLHLLKSSAPSDRPLAGKNAALGVEPSSALREPFTLVAPSAFGQGVRCSFVSNGIASEVVVKVPREITVSQSWISEWAALSALPKHSNLINLSDFATSLKLWMRMAFCSSRPSASSANSRARLHRRLFRQARTPRPLAKVFLDLGARHRSRPRSPARSQMRSPRFGCSECVHRR